jgi:hypothetical protein
MYGAQLTGCEGEKGKHTEILSIIWWSNMRRSVSVFDDQKCDGVHCILHATRCSAPDGFFTSYQTRFETTDVLFTLHGKAHTSLNTERPSRSRPRPRHLQHCRCHACVFLPSFLPGTDSTIPHFIRVFSASEGAGANTYGGAV